MAFFELLGGEDPVIIVIDHDNGERSTILFVKHGNCDGIRDASDLQFGQVFLFTDEVAALLRSISLDHNLTARVGLAGQAEIALHPDRVDGELADLLLGRRVSRR